ncbi:hypothetical protein Pelo_10293 [Pelomyxa schiedti]|nr:hypothetical protein Pelo_10293 [Pelomyxa schiedti]
MVQSTALCQKIEIVASATAETSRQNILHEIQQQFSLSANTDLNRITKAALCLDPHTKDLVFCYEELKQNCYKALEQTLNLKSADVATMIPEAEKAPHLPDASLNFVDQMKRVLKNLDKGWQWNK